MPETGAGRGARKRVPEGTRGLLALVIGLGVLILAGFSVVVVTLVHRSFFGGHAHAQAGIVAEPALPLTAADARPEAQIFLGEPDGTRIVSLSSGGGRFALLLSGGGTPDRVVLVDPRTGRRTATIHLSASPAPPPTAAQGGPPASVPVN